MRVTNAQVVEFIQFCKFVLAYTGLLSILNIVLLNKEFNLILVLTSAVPALISYFGFKFLSK